MPLVAFTSVTPVQIVLGLLVWGVGVFGLPWTLPTGGILAAALLLVAWGTFSLGFLGAGGTLAVALWLGVVGVVALGGLRFALEIRLQLVTRISQQLLSEYCASVSASAVATVRLYAALAKVLVGSRAGLIATGAGSSELVEQTRVVSSKVDALFARGVVQRVSDLGEDAGIFIPRDLSEQFRAPFHDWFRRVPRSCLYAKFLLVLDEREQGVAVLIPVSLLSRILGTRRILKVLAGLQALAQISLAASRGRFLASDSLLISQRSAVEREGEVNELVHMVNNVAQDIAMQCEHIHQLLEECRSSGNAVEKLPLVVKELRELETASRNLSSGVSDTKLLNELLRIGSFSRTDVVSILPIVDDLRAFADYRSKRRGIKCSVEADISQAVAVKVTSREFLETCLRTLFKESIGEVAPAAELRIFCRANDDVVVFEFLGFGNVLSPSGTDFDSSDARKPEWMASSTALDAVRRFAELCAGAFEVRPADAPYQSRFVMSLPRGTLLLPKRASRGKWALFVDDNPQVTAFYGRVAEALAISFYAAPSVTDALKIVEREGQPRFAISDLQLGEETGLDLVRNLRERFGKDLPIIVVSGNVAEDVRVQVQQAGATNFLAKPVGRARLVAEMQSILGL